MPALIRELAVSGSRKSDGTANASGKVFLYSPGTTTLVAGYKDDSLSEAWTTDGGGIPLDAGGRVKIWINDAVDVVITDSDDAILDTMDTYNWTRAEQVQVENPNYTGAVTDSSGAVSQGLGGKTNLDLLLDAAASSLGDNFQYQESTGATSRNYIDVITGQRVSVKDFGALGNNVADDTAAIQLGLNEAARLHGTLLFEPGTYLHSGLALASPSGVRIDGRNATLKMTGASASSLVMTAATSCSVANLTIDGSSSTGTGLAATSNSSSILFDSVTVRNHGVNIDLAGTDMNLRNCFATGAVGAGGRAIRSTVNGLNILGGAVSAALGPGVEFASTAARTSIFGLNFLAGLATGILFNSNLTGSIFTIAGCTGLAGASVPVDLTGVTVWPAIRQWGNGVRGPTPKSFNTGTTQTPVIMLGNEIILQADGGGAGAVTVNMPAVLPSGTDANDLYYDFVFVNNAGGAVTWNTVANYVLNGATAVPATAGHTIQVRFRWDSATSKLRECSRGDTVT